MHVRVVLTVIAMVFACSHIQETGDFKVHDELWPSLLVNDQRDIALAQQVYDSMFCSVGKGRMGVCTTSPDTIIVLA